MMPSIRLTSVILMAAVAAAASTALPATAASDKPDARTESITLRERPMASAAQDEKTRSTHVATSEDSVGFNLAELLAPATTCPPAGNATFTWTVTDGCLDGGLYVRFFDETNNLVWPNKTQVYVIDNGRSSVFRLSVKRGAKICYGADSIGGNFYWGVSAEGDQNCPDCCNIVPNTGNLARAVKLVCN